MTPEMEKWLRRAGRHQRRADRCNRELRELHRIEAKKHPEKYVRVLVFPPAISSTPSVKRVGR